MRKTKIICTLGPACGDDDTLRALMLGGMNAARFNFSHGTHETHLAMYNRFKRIRDELGLPIAAVLDTKGPEIRIKTFASGPIELKDGDTFTLTTAEVDGDQNKVSVTYANLHQELSQGCRVLIDDGLIELIVDSISGQDIRCTVASGGPLSSNKSINIPDVKIALPALTEKDKGDLKFAAENDFDFIAASFVRKAEDVHAIRETLRAFGGENIRIISKIENREGVDNLDAIIEASDGVMVARGDLGVEIPAHEVPIIQKRMIKSTVRQGKPVITATQMLDSMIRNPRPTRAEVSDVANAVFDGTSCVMLSGETASGKYPLAALETMVNTILTAEAATDYWKRFRSTDSETIHSINDAITHSACLTAMDLDATAILTSTHSGHTARMIARYRPSSPIAAFTLCDKVRRQLAITWGVYSYMANTVSSTDELFSMCVSTAQKEGIVNAEDTVVITAGIPVGKTGSTNLIKAQKVCEN